MKKLTDQELDSRFKEAAEGFQPAYDSAGWEAMEAKIDQAKRVPWRRWIPLTLLGVIIFSGGVWVGITYEASSNNPVESERKDQALTQNSSVNGRQNENELQTASKSDQETNDAAKRSGQEKKSGESATQIDQQVARNENNIARRNNSVINKTENIDKLEPLVRQNDPSNSSDRDPTNGQIEQQAIPSKAKSGQPGNSAFAGTENHLSEVEPFVPQNENKNLLTVPNSEGTDQSGKLVTNNGKQSVDRSSSVLAEAENHIRATEPPNVRGNNRSSLTAANGEQAHDSIMMHEISDEKAAVDQSETTETVIEQKYKSPKSIFIRMLASPDLSSINYAAVNSVGSNYALLVDYQFSDRWSVSSGGIWSKKKYSSDNEITYGNYTADHLDGTCRILDIPINLSYRFRPHAKASFYASVGFSSYIMVSENYTYTVYTSYGDRVYTDAVAGKNNEWFKTLNLSLGIQYQIAPRLYLQAEPFLKAPLAGVGEGDVLLSSLGVFVGIKYKIK